MEDLICLLATVRTLKITYLFIRLFCVFCVIEYYFFIFYFCQYLHIGAGILSFAGDVLRL